MKANDPIIAMSILKRTDKNLAWLQSILGRENKTRNIKQKLFIWGNCSQVNTNGTITQWGPCPSGTDEEISKILGPPKIQDSIILTEYHWACIGTQSFVTAIIDPNCRIIKLEGLNYDSLSIGETLGECVVSENTVFGISVMSDLEEKGSKNPIVIKIAPPNPEN